VDAPGRRSRNQGNSRKKSPIMMATKNKKVSPHTDVSRALINAANTHSAKADLSGKRTAAPMGALLMTESIQRPFCVFCGNWIVGLNESRHGEIVRKKINFYGWRHEVTEEERKPSAYL
jgi:hypothetical protein